MLLFMNGMSSSTLGNSLSIAKPWLRCAVKNRTVRQEYIEEF
jgi:hypothetical protein